MTMHRFWLAALGAVASVTVFSAELKVERRRVHVTAPIEIAADGHAEIGEIEGASAQLAQLARTLLSKQRYSPAQREGKPVASKWHVAAMLLLVPVDDEFEVSLGSVWVGPRVQNLRPPDYSPDVARREIVERVVLLRIQVDEEGRPVASTVVAPLPRIHERVFERDAIKVVRDWRFDPLLIEGKPVAYEVIQPFWFHEYKKEKLVMSSFQCPSNDSIPRADTQNGCQVPVEVTGMRVRGF